MSVRVLFVGNESTFLELSGGCQRITLPLPLPEISDEAQLKLDIEALLSSMSDLANAFAISEEFREEFLLEIGELDAMRKIFRAQSPKDVRSNALLEALSGGVTCMGNKLEKFDEDKVPLAEWSAFISAYEAMKRHMKPEVVLATHGDIEVVGLADDVTVFQQVMKGAATDVYRQIGLRHGFTLTAIGDKEVLVRKVGENEEIVELESIMPSDPEDGDNVAEKANYDSSDTDALGMEEGEDPYQYQESEVAVSTNANAT